MTINVTNLKNELNNLNKLLEDYEDIYLNMYNEFSSSSFFWYDEKAKNFFNDINKEKIKMNTMLTEFKDLSSIYNYIIISYEKFGNNIQCELSARDEIVSNINNYRNKLNGIINSYNNLDLRNCAKVSNLIISEKNKLDGVSNQVDELYNKVNNFYNEIETIEREIKLRLSKIKIETIKENIVNDYV